jgi:transcriptional regulator with GAF, ATPase, and Fis domain
VGHDFSSYLSPDSQQKLTALIEDLDARPKDQQYQWIPGGLLAVTSEGEEFRAETTLSRFQMEGKIFHTLILRNVNDRLEAEQKIHSLTVQSEYLREEIKELHNFDEIIGESKALVEVLHDVEQVGKTDTTVLILGETGTGKELFARALHASSRRSDKPLIKVNCAAIPTTLMESEFFGHEKGAFTGATSKRDGRFLLADGGTIFLDEVGELPLDLQVKLLRVLQEGELEPVGSSRTQKVDVRVLAATNRALHQAVQDGDFREDLYYRLNVFPLTVPPLRDRGNDVALLASAFAQRFARKMGRTLEPLSEEYIRRLQACSWPGNVRELENVIQRAVITAQEGCLNLDRALPRTGEGVSTQRSTTSPEESDQQIRTVQELQALERDNLIRALKTTGWKVSGKRGAAQLLGMNPSTLNSRMKALGIERAR